MTATLISLVSMFLGILGANGIGLIFKKYSFGFIGNTIAGVFGSILFIKTFGRLGFDPQAIVQTGDTNVTLLLLNSIVSLLGGAIAVRLVYIIRVK